MAAKCCTSRTVKRFSFPEKNKRASAGMNRTLLKARIFGKQEFITKANYINVWLAPKATSLGEMTQNEVIKNNNHYAVQGHSRSPILAKIKSPYVTSYL